MYLLSFMWARHAVTICCISGGLYLHKENKGQARVFLTQVASLAFVNEASPHIRSIQNCNHRWLNIYVCRVIRTINLLSLPVIDEPSMRSLVAINDRGAIQCFCSIVRTDGRPNQSVSINVDAIVADVSRYEAQEPVPSGARWSAFEWLGRDCYSQLWLWTSTVRWDENCLQMPI